MTALEQWRAEIASGTRTVATFDALWRQACREAEDREWAQITERRVSNRRRDG